jgi:PKD repeat protein
MMFSCARRGAGTASRLVVWALCGTLAFSGLGAGFLNAAEGEGSLSITTDPAGAKVFVDGRAKGVTPLTLDPIAAGPHRIKLFLKGYLENDREVVVEAGAKAEVSVSLTVEGEAAAAPPAATTEAPAAVEARGKSKKKLLLIGAPIVLGGAAFALLSGGAPEPGTVTVSPAGLGMAGLTSYTFTSEGTKPELAFDWDFGDGTTGQGQSVTHTFARAGTYAVKLTVSKSGQDPVSPPEATVTVAQDLTGIFRGTIPGVGNAVALDIAHRPGRIQGQLYWEPPVDRSAAIYCMVPCKGNVSGAVAASSYPTDVNFQGRVLDTDVTFVGRSTDGKTLTGTTTWTELSSTRRTGGGATTLTRE